MPINKKKLRKKIGDYEDVGSSLNPSKLNKQADIFKLTMTSNAKAIMKESLDVNPITQMSFIIEAFSTLQFYLSEYMKMVVLAIVMVLGLVEDERTFNTLAFVKNNLINRLNKPLCLAIGTNLLQFGYNSLQCFVCRMGTTTKGAPLK